MTAPAVPARPSHHPHPRLWAGGGVAGLFLLIALVLVLASLNANMLRGPISAEASLMAHRPIAIRGDLKLHLFSWTPGAEAYDVTVGATPGVGPPGLLAQIGKFAIKVKLTPLFVGRVELPLVEADQPKIWAYRDAEGQDNWRPAGAAPAPTRLPPIQHLAITGGQLQLIDKKRRIVLRAGVQSSETQVGSGRGSFQLTGQGSINQEPFVLNLTGGALIDVKTDQPYHFSGQLRSGSTQVAAQGVLPHPFDLGQLQTALTVSGVDLAQLYDLTGVAFPNTPAYRLSADVTRDDRKYTFRNLAGHIGDSDLEGRFVVDHDGKRPKVDADLRSRSLDMVDLAAVLGGRPKGTLATAPAAAAAGGVQVAGAAAGTSYQRLLPDAKLDLTRIRSTDAKLRYHAASILARPGLPLRSASFDVRLDHGLLIIDPLAFDFPQGSLSGSVRIDARDAVPQDQIDLKITNIRLQDLLTRKGGAQPAVEGVLEARAKLSGHGASVHEAASSADGDVTFVVPNGAIRQSFAELLGIDVSRALGLLLAKDQSQMGVRCAVADFHADHGVLDVRNLVLDTDKVLAKGSGHVNLADESLALTLQGQPKGFRLIRVQAPITVGGHLTAPAFGVKPGAAPMQLGAAVALGAVLSPVAAILPFVDPGLAHDADCVQAVQSARALGAPVSTAATTPNGAKAAPVKGAAGAK